MQLKDYDVKKLTEDKNLVQEKLSKKTEENASLQLKYSAELEKLQESLKHSLEIKYLEKLKIEKDESQKRETGLQKAKDQ